MNTLVRGAELHTAIDATDGVTFREEGEDRWIVTIDGQDERTITKSGSSYIAWVGHQDRCWCFAKALRSCADHARFHRATTDAARKDYAEQLARIQKMPVSQVLKFIRRLEAERELLNYADSHMDVVGRQAAITRQINEIKQAVQ
jgi:hypothetical protein